MLLRRRFRHLTLLGVFLTASLLAADFVRAESPEIRRSSAAIERILGQTSAIDFRNTRLEHAMRALSKRHRVVIAFDEAALNEEGISVAEPVTLKVSGIQFRSVLALILQQFEIGFMLSDGRILITSQVVIEESLENRLYHISDLTKARIPCASLVSAILNLTQDAWEEIDGAGGIIKLGREKLLIRQTQPGHRNVKQLIDKIRSASHLGHAEKSSVAERRIRQELSKTTEIRLARASIRQACKHFARKHNIPILIDSEALREEGITGNERVDSRLSGISLKSALNLILTPFGLEAIIQNEVLWITSAMVAEETLEIRYYHLNRIRRAYRIRRNSDVVGSRHDSIFEIVHQATSGPWEEIDGDGGVLTAVGGLMLCSQSQRVHAEIEDLLQQLSRVKGLKTPQPPVPRHERIYRELRNRTECSFADTPLFKVRDFFAARHGIPIRLDEDAMIDVGIRESTPITAELSDVTLFSALQLVLRSRGLTPIVHNEVLLITSEDAAKKIHETRVYDLSKLPEMRSFQEDELAIMLLSMTSGPWEEVDGEGGLMRSLPGCIIIRQSQAVHHEIENVLRRLARRTIGRRHSLTATTAIENANAKVLKALRKRVSVRLLRAPLNYALETLQREYGMRYLLDVDALKEEGISVNSRVTANRSNIKLETILNQMLEPLKLRWVVRDEVVLVTTKLAAEELFEVQIFGVPLLTTFEQEQQFLDELLERLEPHSTWEELDGDGGRMTILGGNLFVRQRQHVFPLVAKELDRLR